MTEWIHITSSNIDQLEQQIPYLSNSTFRYFKTRPITVINNHVITVLMKVNGDVVGYGHIDYDHNYWVGLCVKPEYRNCGYGKQLLQYLIIVAKIKQIPQLHLTVDKSNGVAYNMYLKHGFEVLNDSCCNNYHLMRINIIP